MPSNRASPLVLVLLVTASCTHPHAAARSHPTVDLTWHVLAPVAGHEDQHPVELVATIDGVVQRIALPLATGSLLPENQRLCSKSSVASPEVARLGFYEGGSMTFAVTRPRPDRLVIARTLESDGRCDGDCPVDRTELHTLTIPAGAKVSEAIVTVGSDGVEAPYVCP